MKVFVTALLLCMFAATAVSAAEGQEPGGCDPNCVVDDSSSDSENNVAPQVVGKQVAAPVEEPVEEAAE